MSKTEKDFENSLEYWRDLAKMLREELKKTAPNEPEVKAQDKLSNFEIAKAIYKQVDLNDIDLAVLMRAIIQALDDKDLKGQAALSGANADITKETQSFDTSQTLNENAACGEFDEWYAKEFQREYNQKDHLSKEWTRKAFIAGQKSTRGQVKLPDAVWEGYAHTESAHGYSISSPQLKVFIRENLAKFEKYRVEFHRIEMQAVTSDAVKSLNEGSGE